MQFNVRLVCESVMPLSHRQHDVTEEKPHTIKTCCKCIVGGVQDGFKAPFLGAMEIHVQNVVRPNWLIVFQLT